MVTLHNTIINDHPCIIGNDIHYSPNGCQTQIKSAFVTVSEIHPSSTKFKVMFNPRYFQRLEICAQNFLLQTAYLKIHVPGILANNVKFYVCYKESKLWRVWKG